MKILGHFWDNLKTEIDIWFFYLFLLTLPFSIRKVITFFPVRGQFNEYTGIYLYLSDIFLVLALFSWIIILCHKYSILSIDTVRLIPPSQNVPRGTFDGAGRHKLWTRLYPQFSPQYILAYISLILVLWSFISILWSDNHALSLFRSLKLLEFFLMSIYVAFRVIPQVTHTKCSTPSQNVSTQKECSTPAPLTPNVPRGTFGSYMEWNILSDIIKLIIFGGVINSILAIWQFIIQHSIGLTFLKESLLSSDIDGVAKIALFGHKMIRAYGFFPHPNILGGFLLFSIILTIYYWKMFHVEHYFQYSLNVPRGTFNESTSERSNNSPLLKGLACRQAGMSRRTEGFLHFFTIIIIAIQIIALILTFSKSATIGLIITLLYINVPRGTFRHFLKLVHSFKIERIEKKLEILFQKIFGFFQPWDLNKSSNKLEREENNPNKTPCDIIVPRGTISEKFITWFKKWLQMFHACLSGRQVEHLAKFLLLTISLLFVAISIFPNISQIQSQSLDQREILSIVPRGTITHNPILGVGQGQLVWSMRNNPDLLDWQFQPVHNVFLLIWSELGIIGLILFIWLLWKMFHVEHFNKLKKRLTFLNEKSVPEISLSTNNVPRGTLRIFQGILLGFIFIILFDHHLWDIQQGQVMFWLVIGFILGLSLTNKSSGDNVSL